VATDRRYEKPAVVYHAFNAAGELLYVGVTCNLRVRLGAHRRETPWWGEVADVKHVGYDDRRVAERAEKTAIWREKPRYNRNSGIKPPVLASEVTGVPWRPGRCAVYAETGGADREQDILVGCMESAELAELVCALQNANLAIKLEASAA
jgi:hypothetical protein